MTELLRVKTEALGKLSATKGQSIDTLEGFMDLFHPDDKKKHKLITDIITLFPLPAAIGQDTDVASRLELLLGPLKADALAHTDIPDRLTELLGFMRNMEEDAFGALFDIKLKTHEPKYVMCLFVCGLITTEKLSFAKLNTDDVKERTYLTKFLEYFLAPDKITVCHVENMKATAWTDLMTSDTVIPADLFLTDVSDTTPLKTDKDACILGVWDTESDYTDYNIEVWWVSFMWSCRDKTDTKLGSYGAKAGHLAHIFLYNLPGWSATAEMPERDDALNSFIRDPFLMYTSSMTALDFKGSIFVCQSEGLGAKHTLLYVYLLIMAHVSEYNPQLFVHCVDVESAKLAFGMNDFKCIDVVEALELKKGLSRLLWYTTKMSTPAIEHLTVAHLKLMKDGGYKFSAGASPPPFFVINPWTEHKDTILSTRPVIYNWVFNEEVLAGSKTWTTILLKDINNIGDWHDKSLIYQRIGVYRRILHAMWPHITDEKLKERVLNFFKDVTVGMAVDFGSSLKALGDTTIHLEGRIVYDWEKLGADLTMNGASPIIKSGVRAEVSKYFGKNGNPTGSDFAHKYVVRGGRTEAPSYFIRDSYELKVDPTKGIVTEALEDPGAPGGDGADALVEAGASEPVTLDFFSAAPDGEPELDPIGSQEPRKTTPYVSPTPSSKTGYDPGEGLSGSDDSRSIHSSDLHSENSFDPDRESRETASGRHLKRLLANLENVHGRQEYELSSRKERITALSTLSGEERRRAEEEIKKHETEIQELTTLNQKLKTDIEAWKLYEKTEKAELDAVHIKVAGLEVNVKKLEGDIAEMIKDHDTIKTDKEAHMQAMIQQHDDAMKELNDKNLLDMKTVLENHRKALDARTAQHDAAMKAFVHDDTDAKAANVKLELENTNLKKEVQELTIGKAADQAAIVRNLVKQQGIIDGLQIKLSAEEASLTHQAHENADLIEGEQDMLHENADLSQRLRRSEQTNKKLRDEVDNVAKVLEVETKRTDESFASQLQKLDDKLNAGMDAQINVLQLIALLKSGKVGKYQTFYGIIKETQPTQETYSTSALFLMLESMAGTWKMIGRDGFTEVLVRKLVYDRRLWDTIANGDKRVFYTLNHLRGFIRAFDLGATILEEADTKLFDSDVDIDEGAVAAARAAAVAAAVAGGTAAVTAAAQVVAESDEPAPLRRPRTLPKLVP